MREQDMDQVMIKGFIIGNVLDLVRGTMSASDFADLEEAVSYAKSAMSSYMESLARKAGAGDVKVRMVRRDHRETSKLGWAQVIYLNTELVFTAVGRPGMSEAWDVPGMH